MSMGINVLSLFDGMSCGQIALNRCGVKYDNYFASEIDKHAIKVTQANYPDTVQLGDVTQVKAADLPKIDLLIGGSPCQGFSFSGKQLNFEDSRSKLFFEFVRLLKEVKPKYFLLENVAMKKEYEHIITDHLGVEPIKINSALVSAQTRKRLYWTNIPNIKEPADKNIAWRDVNGRRDKSVVAAMRGRFCINGKRQDGKQKTAGLTQQYIEFRYDSKTNALTTVSKDNVVVPHTSPKRVLADDFIFRYLTPVECERLQTVPDNYTACVSNIQRCKMLGNGWTVDVIAHILKSMLEEQS